MTWPSASGGGYDPQAAPGFVNPPAIFEPSTLLSSGSPQVWVAASGGPNWGGALVSISFDGVNYDTIGTITAPAYQGVLSAALAAASGLDTTNTLAIDLTESAGVLPTAATHADATSFRTLVWITPNFTSVAPANGELLAYGAVSATGTYTSNLTYLERGLYGTTGQSFTGGGTAPAFFTRIDLGEVDTTPNSVLAWNLPPQYIGATVSVKFQSFNVFGEATEDISTVAAYSYTPSGQGFGGGAGGVPTTPTGLAGYARGPSGNGFNQVQWTANPASDHVQNYTVLRRTHGTGSYAAIGTSTSTSYDDNSAVTGIAYDYELTATNAAGTSAAAGPVTVVTN